MILATAVSLAFPLVFLSVLPQPGIARLEGFVLKEAAEKMPASFAKAAMRQSKRDRDASEML